MQNPRLQLWLRLGTFFEIYPMLIDIHTHTHKKRHPKIIRQSNNNCYPTPDQLVTMLDEDGIDKAVVMCTVSPEMRWTIVAPEEVLEICGMHRDRLIPFCSVDPRYLMNGPKSNFLPLLEAYKELGCKGIGEYIPNIPFDDPLNQPVFSAAEQVGMPITFHIAPTIGGYYGLFDEPGLPRLEKTLKAFPQLVLLAHSQPFWADIGVHEGSEPRPVYPKGKVTPGRVVDLMRAYANLHGDLSGGSGLNAISRDPEFGYAFLEEFQDRLYFGTDIANVPQDNPIVPYFKKLKADKRISDEAYEKITWKNANQLLGLQLD